VTGPVPLHPEPCLPGPVPRSGRDKLAGVPDPLVSQLRAAGCVFAEQEARLLRSAAAGPVELAALLQRRIRGVPLEHILGWAEFCGIRVVVRPEVFIPRGRTELLARQAAVLVGPERSTVVDMCCGCGAIGRAIVTLAGAPVRLHAADIDPVAVACAQENLVPVGGQVHHGDLYGALPAHLRGRVDVLAANVPYVPAPAIGATRFWPYEPSLALSGGDDGLDVLRRLAVQAAQWLAPGGHLLVEAGRDQAPVAGEVMDAAGLSSRVLRDDEAAATVVIGRRARPVNARRCAS
jgi:release factor glutamine methyltransferase